MPENPYKSPEAEGKANHRTPWTATAANKTAVLFLAFGIIFHTFAVPIAVRSFQIGLWLWMLSPYIAGAAMFFIFRQPYAVVGALVLPALLDIYVFASVFLSPQSSTAGIALVFAPLLSLFIFVPLGGLIGAWVGKSKRSLPAPH